MTERKIGHVSDLRIVDMSPTNPLGRILHQLTADERTAAGHWISVEDTLPAMEYEVLVWRVGACEHVVAWLEDDGWHSDAVRYVFKDVTHWAELRMPP